MALVFIDGFDHYASADIGRKGYSTGGTPNTNWGVGSGYSRRAGVGQGAWWQSRSSSYYMRANLPSSDDVMTVGFAFYALQAGDSRMGVFSLRDTGGYINISFVITDSMILQVYRGGAGGTWLGESASPLPITTWMFLEVKVYIHSSAGYVYVRKNGEDFISLTSKNTQYGSANVAAINFGSDTSAVVLNWAMDDLYVCDNSGAAPYDSFLGDLYIDTVFPDANGDTNDWTANTGERYAAVDDPTSIDADTTYVSETVNESDQLFSMGALSAALGPILAVQEVITVRKDTSPTVAIRPLFRTTGDADHEGGLKSLGDAYVCKREIWVDNPDDSQDWEPTDIDNGQFGMIFTYTTTTSA